MRQANCPEEAAVARAVRTGSVDGALASHAAGCDVCRGIVQAASWMQALAGSSEGGARALPDAGLVYWKARLAEKEAKAEKAQDVLDWAEMAAVSIAIGLAGWGAWRWSSVLQGLIAWFAPSLQLGAASFAAPILVLSVGGVLGLLAVVLAYPILMDE